MPITPQTFKLELLPANAFEGIAVGGTVQFGDKARFVVLENGLALEIKNSSDIWVEQLRWEET